MQPCASRALTRRFAGTAHRPDMTIITDPLFYLLAIPAIVALGLGKGGFAGVGMISTPLLALIMPPLQAAAILLPILLCQDAISVWVYRRRLERAGISRCCCPARWSASASPGCSPPTCRTPMCEIAVGADRLVLRRSMPGSRKVPARAAAAERAASACSGARSRASPRPSSRSARRPTRSTSCRSGSTSSP